MNEKPENIESINVFDRTKWGVHVLGPDNIFAAKSFKEAVDKAEEFNKMIQDVIYPVSNSEYHAVIFARIFVWEEQSNCEHKPEETDWTAMV